MNTVWKVLLGLALVVPMGAYVVGSLAASAADDPTPRPTIVIQEPSTSPTPSSTATPTPPSTPTHSSSPSPSGSATSDDGVEVITPDYDDVEENDDHGGRGRGGDDKGGDDKGGDDKGGHGGGEDH
ncbi:hypothetical protein [Nocardioides sp. URHA0020]|uniref:hypothetical protein n=1 Tax=Nocardioides sp. URHA0020 TaxID=1380392 RepID=UPI00048EA227|nr:hypothetical protein [Nocardioides sp. URHA0020]